MYDEKEVKKFLDDKGKIKIFPSKRKKQINVLYYLIEKFELGKKYSELEVNEIIGANHNFDDVCTLRRELVNHGLLLRKKDCSQYWRAIKENEE